MMYVAEGWILRKSDEMKIRGAEMWFYRRLLWVSWTQKRTNRSILEELGEKITIGTSHPKVIYILWPCIPTPGKWTNEIDVQRKSTGKKRVEDIHKPNYISNMTSWIGCNIEQLFKLGQDRERWCEASFNAARTANIKHDDAVMD